MIRNQPTADTYRSLAKDYLNLACEVFFRNLDLLTDDSMSKISINTDGELEEIDVDDVNDLSNPEWNTSYFDKRFRPSVMLVQQSAEFFILGDIIEISPFLILSESPDKWKGGSSGVSFDELKTIEAVTLPKVHRKVCERSLGVNFQSQFELWRKIRNSIVHSIPSKPISPRKFVVYILTICQEFRVDFIRERLAAHEFDAPLGNYRLEREYLNTAEELRAALDLLQPSQSKELLGIDTRAGRFYVCPKCYNNTGSRAQPPDWPHVAKLKNESELLCPVCDTVSHVTRASCIEDDCKGNVIGEDNTCSQKFCMTCLSPYDGEL